MKRFFCRFRQLFIILAVVSIAVGTVRGEEWRAYTGFDCQPRRIMDGGRYTYVWVMQVLYTSCYGADFNTPRGGIIYYDRQHPEKGFRSIHERSMMHTAPVTAVAYNPRGKYLLVVYSDSLIEILTDSGEVYRIDDLKDMPVPYDKSVNNITFPILNNDAWIATQSGYVQIDGDSFRVARKMWSRVPFTAICQVGSRVIAISEGRLFTASANDSLSSADAFIPVADSVVDSPEVIMPVSDTAFATLYKGSGPADKLGLVSWIGSNAPRLTPVLTDVGFSNQMNTSIPYPASSKEKAAYHYPVRLHHENNILPTRDGYFVFSLKYAYHIKRGVNANGTLNVEKRKFANESPLYVGTEDFEKFWYYTRRKGFHLDRASGYDGATTWVPGETVAYQGPLFACNASLIYHRDYGMLSVPDFANRKMQFYNAAVPLLISGLKNGEWHNYSPSYNVPEACETNTTLMADYLRREEGYFTYPLTDPSDITIDSEFPDYLWMGSFLNGVAAINLKNPKGPVLHFGNSENEYSIYPGFKVCVPLTRWKVYCPWKVGGCDAEGVLWTIFIDSYDVMGDGDALNIGFLTPDARREAMITQDVTKMGDWKWISYKMPKVNLHGYTTLLALRHPANKNKLLISDSSSRTLLIYDHNGTPEDSSDDTVKQIKYIQTSKGRQELDEIFSLSEDPVTGKLLFGSLGQFYELDAGSPCANMTIKGDIFRTADGTPVAPYERVHSVAFDEYGRCWLGLYEAGVIGISADRKEVIAKYDSYNSPLPDNDVYSLCWNRETKELMISCRSGMVSVKPDSPGILVGSRKAVAYAVPAYIDPGYSGSVTLHNIPAESVLTVVDAKGDIVASIPASVKNGTVWNLNDNLGHRVGTGLYKVRDEAGLISQIEIMIMR